MTSKLDAFDRLRRSEDLLAVGDYAEGFRLYEAWREVHPDQHKVLPLPLWRGEPLAGRRLLVVGEQGFGDQIMHARFAKLVQASGESVAWLCERPLERLFNRCLGVPAVAPEPGRDIGQFHFYCPSSSLPNAFFPPLSEPPAAPYLASPPANVIAGLSVGVVPSGNPAHQNDANRTIRGDDAAGLLSLSGAVDLRPESTGAQDFYDTATVISGLDLVITVDTSTAHLAGAMGKPVWVLLPFQADWRWQRGRTDSPWYPSARLFRQSSPGDWSGVLRAGRAELEARKVR